MDTTTMPPVPGGGGLIVVFLIYPQMLCYSAGDGIVAGIAAQIHQGDMVFMRREYTILAPFVSRVTLGLFVGFRS